MKNDEPSRAAAPISYSVRDACSATGLGRNRLFVAIANNEVESRKFGRRRVIMADSLRAFVERGEAA